MAITLSGYEILFSNQVYVKDAFIDTGRELLPAKELIWLSKYTVPSKEEVVNYLQQKVQKIDSLAGSKQLSILEQALTSLSGESREIIKTNREEVLGQLIEEVPLFANQEVLPRRCLQVTYGLALTEVLEKNINKTNNPNWHPGQLFYLKNKYSLLCGSKLNIYEDPVEKWIVFLTLENELLPKKAIVNSLLEFGSVLSDHLRICRSGLPYGNYPKQEVKGLLGIVYKGLSGKAAEATDISNILLDQVALDLLEPLLYVDHLKKVAGEKPNRSRSPLVLAHFGGSNKSGSDKPN